MLIRRRRGERGSVLALVPAGFLVLIMLGALALDSAIAYLGQQQLHDALSAAANDAVGAGLSNSSFYGGGAVGLDPAVVDATVCSALAAQDLSRLHGLAVTVAVAGDAVEVHGSAVVDAVFGRAIPGWGRHSVHSSADAVLSRGPVTGGVAIADAGHPLSCR